MGSLAGGQRRVVGIAASAKAARVMERRRVRRIERGSPTQAFHEVRIGDIRTAKCHPIGVALLENRLCRVLVHPSLAMTTPPNSRLSAGSNAPSPCVSRINRKRRPH